MAAPVAAFIQEEFTLAEIEVAQDPGGQPDPALRGLASGVFLELGERFGPT